MPWGFWTATLVLRHRGKPSSVTKALCVNQALEGIGTLHFSWLVFN